MAENGSVSGHYDGENYASPSPSTGSGNSIRHMGGTSKELFNFIFQQSNKYIRKNYCKKIAYENLHFALRHMNVFLISCSFAQKHRYECIF